MQDQPSTSKKPSQPHGDTCGEESFNDVLKLLGDFWVLRIIGTLEQGPLRFCEIERALVHSNPVTLTNRLKKLEDNTYISRQTEMLDKQSVSYELTPKGLAVLPIVSALRKFSLEHT